MIFRSSLTTSVLSLSSVVSCANGSSPSSGVDGEPSLLIGVMEDGHFREIRDGDRVPGVFGSQGALMVVGSVEVHGVENADALELDWVSFTSKPGARSHQGVMRRRATVVPNDTHGDPGWRVETLYWVVEWVGLDFDMSEEREVTLRVGAQVGDEYLEVEARVGIDVQGEPFPSHPTSPR